MLTLDVAQMSHAELVDAVSRRCSQFGPVREIAILQPPDQPGVAFALVGMRALRDIDKVVAGLGAKGRDARSKNHLQPVGQHRRLLAPFEKPTRNKARLMAELRG